MLNWQNEYNTNQEIRNLARNFNSYKTIDWQHETYNENKKYYEALKSTNDDTNPPSTADSISTINSIINEISSFKIIKSRIWINFQIWFVLTIIGITIGSIASFLNILTEFLNELKFWTNYTILQFIIYTLFSISFGVFASYLCVNYAPNASGSGISEVKVIVSGYKRDDFLSINTLLVKAFTLPFTIASGLSVGKEGPSVHYASCAGNVISRWIIPWFNESYIQLSDIIIASAGSGVAVAFGSPIGGVLFSMEEISHRFKLSTLWKTFYTSLVAITTLQFWNPFGTGQIVMFQVKYLNDWSWNEVIWFILIGLFGGLYGTFISKFNIKFVAFRQRYLKSGITEVFWLCLISSILGYWNIFMKNDMTKVMELLFDSCVDNGGNDNDNIICEIDNKLKLFWILFQLFYAIIIRSLLVIVSYGCKVPCGIFVPSMLIGSTFGKFLGLIVQNWINPNVSSGIYSFLGAGAALSGITGLTFTVVVIMYELTGAIKYVLPTMITIITVKMVNEFLSLKLGGIADQMIKFNGLPYIDLKEDHEFGEAVVEDVMVNQVIGVDCLGMKVGMIKEVLKMDKCEYPLLWECKVVVGVISSSNLKRLITDQDGSDDDMVYFISSEKLHKLINVEGYNDIVGFDELIEFEFTFVNKGTSIYTIFDLFVDIGIKTIYVYDEGKLIGIVNRKDLIRYENYLHYSHHGNVFINNRDEEIFNKIYSFYI